jgi:predicted Zn-dependent protease
MDGLISILPGGVELSFAGEATLSFDWDQLEPEKIPGSDRWRLLISSISGASILLEDAELLSELKTQMPVKPGKNRIQLPSRKWSAGLILLILAVSLLALGGGLWFSIPLVADFAALNIPREWVASMGIQIQKQLENDPDLDKKQTEILRRIYGRMIADVDAEMEGMPIRIWVLQKKEFNAYATPGGHIVVFSGALEKIRNHEELLALLGHETAHIQERHGVRTLFRSASMYAFVAYFLGDFSGLSAVVLDNLQSLQNLQYSRDFEREADAGAHRFLCENHISTEGLSRLMATMQKLHPDEGSVAFLQSHPPTEERIENVKRHMKEVPCGPFSADSALINIFQELKK